MQKVTVIGSNGFIASHVIEELHKRNLYVIGLQRHQVNGRKQKYHADEIYLGDVKDAEVVERVVSQGDYVINLAGILGTSETVENPFPAVEVNIIGTLNILRACKIWGRQFLQIAVGNHWMNNTYSITRTTAERFTLMYAKELGVKANVVRALNAYGPRQSFASYKKIIPSFVLNSLKNKPLKINGDGEQLMDMIYVKDLAEYLCNILLNPEKEINFHPTSMPGMKCYGHLYEAGEGTAYTVNEMAELILKLTKSKSKIEHTEMRKGEPNNSIVKADYKCPTFKVTLEEGLKETIKYYKKNLKNYTL